MDRGSKADCAHAPRAVQRGMTQSTQPEQNEPSHDDEPTVVAPVPAAASEPHPGAGGGDEPERARDVTQPASNAQALAHALDKLFPEGHPPAIEAIAANARSGYYATQPRSALARDLRGVPAEVSGERAAVLEHMASDAEEGAFSAIEG
jgi:hypothetical protein